jgi:hypothetical protein
LTIRAVWSHPAKLLDGGRWDPQVIGLDSVTGTIRFIP